MSIISTIKELKKIMSDFLDSIETSIKQIHVSHGIDNDALTKQVSDAITTNVITPMQTTLEGQITGLQGQVADLQKALQDTVAAINSGDTDGAQQIATAAANSAADSSGTTGAGATGDGTASGAASAGTTNGSGQ